MNIRDELKNIFEQKGVYISYDANDEELLLDSLQFISIIVDVEKTFNVEIDDSYFVQNKLHTFNSFVTLVSKLLNLA